MKICRKCKTLRQLHEFHKNTRGQNVPCKFCERERYHKHKTARLEARKVYREKNKELISIKKNRANATVDEFKKLFTEQDGKCAICFTHQSNLNRRIAVDHDHDTKKIRGLLCDKCNRAIGLLKDRIDILQNAITYLQKHKK